MIYFCFWGYLTFKLDDAFTFYSSANAFFHFCYFLRFFFLSFCFCSYYLHRNLWQSLTQNFPRFSVSCFARARSLSFFFSSVKAHFYFFSLPISSFKYIFVIQLLKFSAVFTQLQLHIFLFFSFLSFFFYFFSIICQSYFFPFIWI